MISSDIRRKFLDFFNDKGHVEVPSDLLVPAGDPTVLFTGAGMNQFKEQFMGKNVTYKRAATCQKCLRTGDLDNVGRTPRHHTFFEMLGNFSFGDYFKHEAIQWAWEFLTDVLCVSRERLWVSVYKDDEEAYVIWKDHVGVDPRKIIKLGDHDNFWPADAPLNGPNGPCGPCSEIFYDRGSEYGCGNKDCGPACDCGRFVEVWNLVFTQFERKSSGKLEPLPASNIDTGMGLERITAVVRGCESNFETDLFLPLTAKINELTGKTDEAALRLVADHTRAAVFAINDGVSPSNEKRGYVVRKLIRRAWLKGNSGQGPFIYRIVPSVTEMFRHIYPEMEENKEHIAAVIEAEERRFNETLKEAEPVLEGMIASGDGKISGQDVFKLVDTYGMPAEVVKDICDSRGIAAGMDDFQSFMKKRKEQSRRGSDMTSEFIFKPDIFKDAPRSSSSSGLPLKTRITFIVKNGKEADVLEKDDRAEVITDPESLEFYPEAGGQVGDKGVISGSKGRMRVINTVSSDNRKILRVRVDEGKVVLGDNVELDIDSALKKRVAMNHTATHLLQAALRSLLGSNVKQSGSLVDHRRLRFDFTHLKKLSPRDIFSAEEMINEWIRDGIDVCIEEKDIAEAKKEGALSFFGEKYADTVRVVKVGERSMELCGGTHVENTSQIGLFAVVSESSVASGIRRIEAVTGEDAETFVREKIKEELLSIESKQEYLSGENCDDVLSEARNIVDGRVEFTGSVLKKVNQVLLPELLRLREKSEREMRKKEKAKETDVFSGIRMKLDDAIENLRMAGEIKLVAEIFPGADMALLRKAAHYAGKAAPFSVIFLGGGDGEKAYIVCSVPDDIVEKGISAREIICCAAYAIGGTGGGKDNFAQAGGKDPDELDRAVEKAVEFIEMKQEG
ncbi:MAG: alanine--tRNA ligase [Candidatus Omnitrophota bacterium]